MFIAEKRAIIRMDVSPTAINSSSNVNPSGFCRTERDRPNDPAIEPPKSKHRRCITGSPAMRHQEITEDRMNRTSENAAFGSPPSGLCSTSTVTCNRPLVPASETCAVHSQLPVSSSLNVLPVSCWLRDVPQRISPILASHRRTASHSQLSCDFCNLANGETLHDRRHRSQKDGHRQNHFQQTNRPLRDA